jgi:hypothetical protein
MPKVSELYLKTAIVFLLVGIGLGLHMSITGNHEGTGAHAHANLLGWVTMALFGTYYALVPRKAGRRIAMLQYGVYTLGCIIMLPALYLMLSGKPSLEPLVAVGSLIVLAGVLLFAFVLFTGESTSVRSDMRAAE